MRTALLSFIFILSLTPVSSMALEPVNEAHAMFYYQVPLGGAKPEQKKHSFGFRMDHTSYQHGEMIQYHNVMKKPAAFDFKMGHDGVEGMYVAGVDYLAQYRLKRAAEDESGDSENVEMAEEEDKGPNAVEKVASDVGNTIEDIYHTIPLGFMIGGIVAIVLVAGVGG